MCIPEKNGCFLQKAIDNAAAKLYNAISVNVNANKQADVITPKSQKCKEDSFMKKLLSRHTLNRIASAVLAAMLILSCCFAASAEEWKPRNDFTVRVPKAAGDTMDTITRLVTKGLTEKYGVNVLISNIPGANGALAAADMMDYDPEGTEMMSAGIVLFTLAPLFSKDIQMNLDDWKFVCGLTSEDFVLIANAKTGLTDLNSVVEYAKANRLLVGTQASGGAIHMLATALFGENGVQWEAVTSDSSGKDVLACANGTVPVAIATTSACAQYIKEGTVVPVLTFGKETYTGYEGFSVPTSTELGFPIVWQSLNYVMTRSEVEDAVVDQMYAAISEYCESAEFKDACAKANIVPFVCNGDTCYEMVSGAKSMCDEMYAKYYQ